MPALVGLGLWAAPIVAAVIDMLVDQSPDGLEVLRGSSTYTYDGNWKVQAENGADGYHVTAVHWNYAATQGRRTADGKEDTIKAMSAGGWARQGGGSYSFKNGHMLLWTNWANPEDRPLWHKRDEWIAKFGEARADWMLKKSRNLCIYPNVYLMDQFSSQIRVLRPISVDKTEATIYCIAPKGESAEARARRITAEFRADCRNTLEEPGLIRLVDELSAASTDFVRFWKQHDVLERQGGERRFMHPGRGAISYQQVTLRPDEHEYLKLVMLKPIR